MNNEIKLWKEKTKGVFHIVEYKKFWDYITNLQTIEQQYSAILSENAELENKITNLKEQLHQASLDIQELTERDMWCPTNCEKLTNLQEENERLKRENYIMLAYLQLIVDIGYDYDGLNNVPTLKYLIDELVNYANMGTKLDDKTIISEGSNGEEYNILGEEILQGENNV